ncbi:hypothetical protein DI09_88p60 [Mitosporidium daphniae]|uniref:TAP42-like protein n=1 Tax=Mitosporidium daphniae TaxID=1485682 RepID=A0A098VMT2_9MICR|nr:uncharacterized protein DI09_88p60 [Mitosporidium daphniae]KGG50124.1 hypothetical protein DI09_88p60 [Mitosporidium daphniae]|eukprot:XP_013236560.1 uncharacterized protein DI09_88p60 [Mitosporidium daphniae]
MSDLFDENLSSLYSEFNRIHSAIFNDNNFKALFVNKGVSMSTDTVDICKSLEALWVKVRINLCADSKPSDGENALMLLCIPAYLAVLFENICADGFARRDVLQASKYVDNLGLLLEEIEYIYKENGCLSNEDGEARTKVRKAVQQRNMRMFLHKKTSLLLERLGGEIPVNLDEDDLAITWLHYLQVFLYSRQTMLDQEIQLLAHESTQSETYARPMFVHKIPSREQIKSKVFTASHNLPTMTMSEFIKKEMEIGNIITGTQNAQNAGPEQEQDEDLGEDQDEDIRTLRQLDEYRDGMFISPNLQTTDGDQGTPSTEAKLLNAVAFN